MTTPADSTGPNGADLGAQHVSAEERNVADQRDLAPHERDLPGNLGEPVRAHGSSDAGSPAAAAGTVPDPQNDKTRTDNPYPASTWERPATGVHRPAAPEGEVAPN